MLHIQTKVARGVLHNFWLVISSAMLLCICSLATAQKIPSDAPATGAVTLIDDRGVAVKLNQKPLRVVTLLPSLGEIVCELQECDRLVGVDRYSNWPDRVKSLPKLGGLDDTHLEALVKLRPDLVLLARSSRVTQRLESLGIAVMALEPQNQVDVQRAILHIALALHLPDAQSRSELLWQKIQTRLDQVVDKIPSSARGARVYFEVGSGYFAAGEASFIGETLKRIGLINVVPLRMGSFPQVNPEFLVRSNPQIIFIAEQSATDLSRRPGWDQMQAIQENKICRISAENSDILVRSGPRMAEAAQLMLACLKRVYQ